MVVTIFRNRLKPGAQDEYLEWAARMSELAASMPGYLSHKVFVAEDGERATLVEFESEEAQRAWAEHPQHREAQRKGRKDFYSEYRLIVCTAVSDRRYPRPAG